MAVYTKNSLSKLVGVHPDLVAVAHRAAELSGLYWQISWGLRTIEQQKEFVASGASTTMRSRHITGHAIDIFATNKDGTIAFWAKHHYPAIIDAFKQAARELGIKIECGLDWKDFIDVYHIELDREHYPAEDPAKKLNIPEPEAVLRFGMVGELVRSAQILLRSIDYPIQVDGDFGPKTRRAVLDLQANHGLEITGNIDATTRAKLNQLNQEALT